MMPINMISHHPSKELTKHLYQPFSRRLSTGQIAPQVDALRSTTSIPTSRSEMINLTIVLTLIFGIDGATHS
jgi:hypothetical protein